MDASAAKLLKHRGSVRQSLKMKCLKMFQVPGRCSFSVMAICIFMKPEAKQSIIAALAEGGYVISFQEGITNLLNELLIEHHKAPIA